MLHSYESDPGPVPNRWLKCPRKSDIIAEKFLAFKTPLSTKFNNKIPKESIFTPEMIFGYVKYTTFTLGLWIDLTNTKRYYDKEFIESKGVKYVKLQCRGHGETPSIEQTTSFIQIVDEFLAEKPLDVIGVHCTHGFNRTGFLIVSYMVEKLDCPVDAALNSFAQARPPGIYKDDYIRELYKRYDDEDDAPHAPPMPNWCFENITNNISCSNSFQNIHNSEMTNKRSFTNAFSLSTIPSTSKHDLEHENDELLTQNNGYTQEECNDGLKDEKGQINNETKPIKKKRRHEQVNEDAKFMAGVRGVKLVLKEPKLSKLQAKVQNMCGWNASGFPGSQPVSMDVKNILLLHEKPYRVSWKADGTRYMLLINGKDEIYFFDRNNSCFQVEKLTFPKRKNLHDHIKDTLLDGEMVIDKVNNEFIPRYLVYDIVQFEGNNIRNDPFYPDRVKCIKEEIIEPRTEAFTHGIVERKNESFGLRDKEFWPINTSEYLLSDRFASKLCHKPDGLIFQPSKEAYTAGQSSEVLKWKPLDMNSIDFLLKLVKESGMGLLTTKVGYLYVGGFSEKFGTIKYSKDIKELDNKIIECCFDYPTQQWKFMRERTDKTFPNSYKTAESVFNSIKQPVTKEGLLKYIDKCRFRDDEDLMPPPQYRKN